MKRVFGSVLALSLATIVGCDRGTPGGPGADPTPNNGNDNTDTERTFTLDVPNLATSLAPGETKTVEIAIKPGDNFNSPVTLDFVGLPTGVTMDPQNPKIEAGQTSIRVSLTAAAEALPGDYEVTVNGKPTAGPAATNKMKITIEKPE